MLQQHAATLASSSEQGGGVLHGREWELLPPSREHGQHRWGPGPENGPQLQHGLTDVRDAPARQQDHILNTANAPGVQGCRLEGVAGEEDAMRRGLILGHEGAAARAGSALSRLRVQAALHSCTLLGKEAIRPLVVQQLQQADREVQKGQQQKKKQNQKHQRDQHTKHEPSPPNAGT
eukprot:scaffold112202_cov19-Tisochrysis_lutea.AAC.6